MTFISGNLGWLNGFLKGCAFKISHHFRVSALPDLVLISPEIPPNPAASSAYFVASAVSKFPDLYFSGRSPSGRAFRSNDCTNPLRKSKPEAFSLTAQPPQPKIF